MSDHIEAADDGAWTWPERLAAAALLALLLGVTGWLVWARYGDRQAASAGGAAGVAGAAPGGPAQAVGGHGAALADPVGADSESAAPGQEGASPDAAGDGKVLLVHVAGAVKNPGVYPLPAGSRVVDALQAAGGRRDDAREDLLNLASALADGDKVYVPSSRDLTAGSAGAGSGGLRGQPAPAVPGWPQAPGRVDLNRADLAALDALPGVGPSLASAIIRYRQEHGPFRSVDDLEKVPGIGPSKLASLRDLVVVR